jgi:4-amino-4-deoxy-L-arabinose transferase-like glycosyltransferase
VAPSRSPRPLELLAAFGVALLALVLLRPASLATPYWWDAAAVYVPGAEWLNTHGFDASPGHFPSDLGRGHTPGFYLILALVFRVFGTSPTTGHALVLAFSAAALAFTYGLGVTWLDRPRALLATLLVAFAPLYLTMSSEALPEIPMTALTVLALFLFAQRRFLGAALAATALVLVKEVGLATPAALAGASLFMAWRTPSERRAWLRAAALQVIPLVFLAAFFVWQRVREGWWVLPYHAGLFSEHHDLGEQLGRVLGSSLVADGRGVALVVALLLALFARRLGLASARTPPAMDRPIALAIALVVLANFVFFAKMFFLERYVLPLHPLIALAIARAVPPPLPDDRRGFAAGTLATSIACVVALAVRWDGEGFDSGETTFRYLHAVNVHQRLLGDIPSSSTILTTWPMTDEMRSPYLGYVKSPVKAISLEWVEATGKHPTVDGVIVFTTMGNAPRLRAQAAERGFHVARMERESGATLELWTP